MPHDLNNLHSTLKKFGFPAAASVLLPDTRATDFQFKAWSAFAHHGTFLGMDGRAFSAPKTLIERRTAP